MTDPCAQTLARLAGFVDVAFAPVRSWAGHGPAAAAAARALYLAGRGIAWRSDSTAEADRRGQADALEELEAAGMLRRIKADRKTVRVRLTDLGDGTARAMADLPGPAAGWWLARAVAGSPIVGVVLGRRWVPEWQVAGTPPHWRGLSGAGGQANRAELLAVESMAGPALARGWIIAGSDSHGRAWYSVGPVRLPAKEPADPKSCPRRCASEAWAAGFSEARALFAAAGRSDRDLGEIPLPCSVALAGEGVPA